MPGNRFDLTLGVVTHVRHWPQPPGAPWAYEPYVREMNVWADLFTTVEVCAPVAEGAMQGHQAPYAAENIRWTPVHYSTEDGLKARILRARQMPSLARALVDLARRSDLLLLRSPGHPPLVGRIIADVLRVPHITKWAGLFARFPGERIPSKLERYLVARSRGPVLVYGPADRPPLVSFLPALMTEQELRHARALAAQRRWEPPWHILSVGRLLPVKGFDLALRGLARFRLRHPDVQWHYTLVGDGPAADTLRALAAEGAIADRVTFLGALGFQAVQQRYARAHVVLMPGVKEGWPKPIAEAWAHGAIPVAAAAGIVPWLVNAPDAGVVFEPHPAALAEALHRLFSTPERMQAASWSSPNRAAALSLEVFSQRLEQVLVERCGLGPV